MEATGGGPLERKTSQNSSRSGHSGTVRAKSRRINTNSSVTSSAPSDKSLISFPSLSPASSPISSRHDALNHILSSHPTSPSPAPRRSPSPPSIVDSLTASSPSQKVRASLFDDAPMNSHHVPGAIHHASDEHIERLLARTGAVALVRQLAEDLAQRDAQMVARRRRAEDRERLLKKMLLDCQVSSLDIETRLRSLEDPGSGFRAGGNVKDLARDNGRKSEGSDTKGVKIDINEMVNQAMRDTVGSEDEHGDDGYLGVGTADGQDLHATIRPGRNFTPLDDEARSTDSGGNADRRWKGTVRGWKEYLWGRATTRSVSGGSSIASDANDDVEVLPRLRAASGPGPRKALKNDLFQPPDYVSNGNGSRSASGQTLALLQDGDNSDSHSQKSSASVASWAVKLVAGTSQINRDGDGQRAVRGRTTMVGNGPLKDPETASLASTKTSKSVVAGTTKPGSESVSGHGARRSAASLSVGSSQPTVRRANSSGPVEMDTILPPGSRPPTLSQTYNDYHPTDFLTDRFGFIYDQRRRKQQKEASDRAQGLVLGGGKVEMLAGVLSDGDDDGSLASPESTSRPDTPGSTEDQGPKTAKRWQDFLKIATSPTELLSDTPSPGALLTPEQDNGEPPKPSQITIASRGSLPPASSTPQPLASPVVSGNATLAKPLVSSGASTPANAAKDQNEPVKLLLEQLTELHDSLQRDKTVRWNEFLRKVRAERRREMEAAAVATNEGRPGLTSMPEVSLADGEIIGVAGLGNKGKVGRAKWKEFKQLVLGGIPVAHRAKVWAECSGASALRVPGYYDDLVNNGAEDPLVVAQIAMDINRTLTDNIFFRKGPGVAKLEEVLLTYSRRNPDIGYCQGMNLIAASLLLIMPTAEDAFWVMTSMIENILPPNYYDHSLLGSRADQQVLRQYVSEILPKLSAHLDDLGIELEALTFQWFLSVFTDCLSAEALFRVWDVVLCTNDGSTFLFQLALALLKLNEKQLLKCSTPAGIYSYINHHMTNHAISIDGLIQASEALKKVIRREEIEERRKRALEIEMEAVRLRNKRMIEREGERNKHRDEQRAEDMGGGGEQQQGDVSDGKGLGELQLQPPVPVEEEEMVVGDAKESFVP
ncbi:hypothetical protein FGG08_000425 [Glutinoglossum americanum]|uniref:Rab-GAP TBC domain-containing protein n=1 Tax=Glutinoglossum americanum TaxID=1670608 RepID=A0A9P8L649_9PEZI|nr:hypothetical protein FGG08_000425 [Glutinoglossum americanum]